MLVGNGVLIETELPVAPIAEGEEEPGGGDEGGVVLAAGDLLHPVPPLSYGRRRHHGRAPRLGHRRPQPELTVGRGAEGEDAAARGQGNGVAAAARHRRNLLIKNGKFCCKYNWEMGKFNIVLPLLPV